MTRRQRRPASPATLRLAEENYSLRTLAEAAGVDTSLASLWLRGERSGPATRKLQAVVEENLDPQAAAEVLALIPTREERQAA